MFVRTSVFPYNTVKLTQILLWIPTLVVVVKLMWGIRFCQFIVACLFQTTHIPNAWVPTDHRCIVWCKQVVLAFVRALFDIVDEGKKEVS